ncbi:hypothetical protein H6P81_014643 [Aristolochia fimbriata]|uniref:Uncharacterized protein n=1 Tax=Aristolochia fimbriata TaxID=158543 RepID=A0AAV7E390_ARIFI|nr:hypothetical protein H6P81_014643 [Aristolochia fimbriata]
MPTFSAISLDRLLEPRGQKSFVKPPTPKLEKLRPSDERKPRHGYISPKLYKTPEVTPLPDSPTSFPPSPYIIDHKRRGPRLIRSASLNDVAPPQSHEEKKILDNEVDGDAVPFQCNEEKKTLENGDKRDEILEDVAEDISRTVSVSGRHDDLSTSGLQDGGLESNDLDEIFAVDSSAKTLTVDSDKEVECEDFFDTQESISVHSNADTEDNGGIERLLKHHLPSGEHGEAFEELSNGGAFYSARCNATESELREIRINLLMEIEKRKQAEEMLSNMQKQWLKMSQKLSLVGLTLPPSEAIFPGVKVEEQSNTISPAEDLSQQVVITRFVANAVGRAASRAEVELEMDSQIAAKNFEINRLSDRLRYYEAVNREMSQRNQQAVEMARRLRHRRKRRQMWFWSAIGLAITLGSSALVWSYLPSNSAGGDTLTTPDVNDDASNK